MEESFKNSSHLMGTSKHISELDQKIKVSDKDRDLNNTTMKSDISGDKLNTSMKLNEQIGSGLVQEDIVVNAPSEKMNKSNISV